MSIRLEKDKDGKLRQRIRIGAHILLVDAALAEGGDDSAPSPHDIFDGSLAACKAITLMLYAARRSIPLDSVDIDIERDASDEKNGRYGLAVKLKLNGDISASDRAKLAEIADRCPIHKLMTQASITVDTQVS